MDVKQAKKPKCECGKLVAIGSVFCAACKDEIERKNHKILVREASSFNKKYFVRSA